MKKRKSLFVTIVLICLGLLLLHRPILTEMGKFLAPDGSGKAEVLILEGNQTLKNGAIDEGARLLAAGRARRVVVVLHQPTVHGQALVFQEKYARLLSEESGRLGLEREKIEIIPAPVDSHPITLKEARFVLARLSQEGVRSAILLSEGFHSRRSSGVYSQEGARVGIVISPHRYFIGYRLDDWWSKADGIHAFLEESVKLAYYLLSGHLSVKFL